jgi:ATP-binding cassette subfamily C protein LapB
VLSQWRRYTAKVANDALKSRFFSVLAVNLTSLIVMLSSVSIVVTGVYLINTGQGVLTLGGLIACMILNGRALSPLGQITSLLTRVQQTRCSLQALNEVMDAEDERPSEKQFLQHHIVKGAIEFEHVTFSYPSQEVPMLDDLSFSVKAGEHVAILGNMGSGKSTLLKLIQGFYHPQKGAVRVDDLDLLQLDPLLIRQYMGYLEQSPKLLFGTALSNIKLKDSQVEDSKVIAAANLSGASRFLNHHPEGFAMPVAEQGKGLSGGQIQSLALARTLLLDPPILLLDEPTSSMDSGAVQSFLQQMKTYLNNKTLLLVTHKQSLLQLVDRIILMQHGKIVMDDKRDKVLNAI